MALLFSSKSCFIYRRATRHKCAVEPDKPARKTLKYRGLSSVPKKVPEEDDRGRLSRSRRQGLAVCAFGFSSRCHSRTTAKASANRTGIQVIRWLLDEHISPALVGPLGEQDICAQAVAHDGLSGRPDHEIWSYPFENHSGVVTTNAGDFIKLLDAEVHLGLIVLRESGPSRVEQWERLLPLVKHLKASIDENLLLNKLVEITAPGHWENPRDSKALDIPTPSAQIVVSKIWKTRRLRNCLKRMERPMRIELTPEPWQG